MKQLFYILPPFPVSELSMALKCPSMLSTEARTEKMPTESWACSSPVSSFQTKAQKPLRVSGQGRFGLYYD
jgi:hypothetical protein